MTTNNILQALTAKIVDPSLRLSNMVDMSNPAICSAIELLEQLDDLYADAADADLAAARACAAARVAAAKQADPELAARVAARRAARNADRKI